MAKNVILFCLVHFFIVGTILWTLQFVLPRRVCHYHNLLAHFLLGGIIAYKILPFTKRIFFVKKLPADKKSVLITGCDSGFGFDIAKRLDSEGYHVFASCLFPTGEGAKSLKESCSSRLQILTLDVTKDESVKKALNCVKENLGDTELWAIVNNAGIAKGFEVEWTPIRDFQDCIDVNTLGVIRVTKAFLPLLRRTKGRVVIITSILGHISTLSTGPYSMSKFATTCFCECLRQEMYPWGVKVIAIEPQFFWTPILDNFINGTNMRKTIELLDKEIREDYGEQFFITRMKILKKALFVIGDRIHKVIDDVEDAMSLEEPCNVYKTCNSIFSRCVIELLYHVPQPLYDIVIYWIVQLIQFTVS